jgi:hypothetical protein
MKTRNVTIQEAINGWVIHDETPVRCRSAVEAQNYVREQDKRQAEETGSTVVTVITWVPQTKIGRMVLKAIGV